MHNQHQLLPVVNGCVVRRHTLAVTGDHSMGPTSIGSGRGLLLCRWTRVGAIKSVSNVHMYVRIVLNSLTYAQISADPHSDDSVREWEFVRLIYLAGHQLSMQPPDLAQSKGISCLGIHMIMCISKSSFFPKC